MKKIAYLEVTDEQRQTYDAMSDAEKTLTLELLSLTCKQQAELINKLLKGV